MSAELDSPGRRLRCGCTGLPRLTPSRLSEELTTRTFEWPTLRRPNAGFLRSTVRSLVRGQISISTVTGRPAVRTAACARVVCQPLLRGTVTRCLLEVRAQNSNGNARLVGHVNNGSNASVPPAPRLFVCENCTAVTALCGVGVKCDGSSACERAAPPHPPSHRESSLGVHGF